MLFDLFFKSGLDVICATCLDLEGRIDFWIEKTLMVLVIIIMIIITYTCVNDSNEKRACL